MRRSVGLAASVAVMIVLVGPLVVSLAALYRLSALPEELGPSVAPLVGHVRAGDEVRRVQAQAVFEEAEEYTVRWAMSAHGLVTEVKVASGDLIESGDVLGVVDGQSVVALTTERPFFRSLSHGAKGDDVRMLQDLLAEFDLRDASPTGTFDYQTRREVAEFNQQFGWPGRSLDISKIGWLPVSGAVTEFIHLQAGITPAPGAGMLVVSDPGQGQLRDAETAGPLTVTSADTVLYNGVELAGIETSTLDPEIGFRLLGLSDDKQTSDGEDEVPIDGRVFELTVVQTRLPTMRVPVGSVVQAPGDGATCLYLVRTGDKPEPFNTIVVGGELGLLEIDPAPSLDEAILLNPLEVVEGSMCAS